MSEQFVQCAPTACDAGSDTAWEDKDLDDLLNYLPSNVTGVALRIDSSSTTAVGVRCNGSTDARVQNVSASRQIAMYVGVDANKIFEIYAGSHTAVHFYVIGYFTDVTFSVNGTDVSTSTTTTWIDVDTGNSNAIGAMFEVVIASGIVKSFGLRKNGSTDNRYNTFSYHNGCIVGCSSGVCEQYIGATTVDLYLLGYITENFTFLTNATDISLGSSGSYQDLTTLSSSAIANLVEIVASSTYSADLRPNGSSDTTLYYYVDQHCWILIGSDVNGVSEGKISNTGCDFYGLGYATAPVAGSSSWAGTWGG